MVLNKGRKSWQEQKRGEVITVRPYLLEANIHKHFFPRFFSSAAVKMNATQVSLRLTIYANKKILPQGPKSGNGSVCETSWNHCQPQQEQNPSAWASPQKYT